MHMAPPTVFFSYAHTDQALVESVRQQLSIYDRLGLISKWYDRMIPAGTRWSGQIDTMIEQAEIILLFMSPAFLDSDYCYEVEGDVAWRRQASGSAHVIPIVLRPCAWQATRFGALQALPPDGVPISTSPDRDGACLAAAQGVMAVVQALAHR